MFDTLMGTRMKTTIGLLSYQKKKNQQKHVEIVHH